METGLVKAPTYLKWRIFSSILLKAVLTARLRFSHIHAGRSYMFLSRQLRRVPAFVVAAVVWSFRVDLDLRGSTNGPIIWMWSAVARGERRFRGLT